MRLTPRQRNIIRAIVARYAGAAARILVFGSRASDESRGGDIDLLLETEQGLPALERARLQHDLQQALGIAVDLVFYVRGRSPTPFQEIALTRGLPL
ncbi:MAG: nucleotidyltransferase family protein [Rhodocyclaceae bacterium]